MEAIELQIEQELLPLRTAAFEETFIDSGIPLGKDLSAPASGVTMTDDKLKVDELDKDKILVGLLVCTQTESSVKIIKGLQAIYGTS